MGERATGGVRDGISAIVQVPERVTAAGVMCPLYVSVGGGEQIFWRFAPDDEPAGWFDEEGRRLGEAALAQPKPGSRISSHSGCGVTTAVYLEAASPWH